MKESKIRTLQYDLERGLSRTLLKNHDTQAWLIQHVAATINWHRAGMDGRTPFQRRTGKSCRPMVAGNDASDRHTESLA